MATKTADFENFRKETGKSPAGRASWTFLIGGEVELTMEGSWSWASREVMKIAKGAGFNSAELIKAA